LYVETVENISVVTFCGFKAIFKFTNVDSMLPYVLSFDTVPVVSCNVKQPWFNRVFATDLVYEAVYAAKEEEKKATNEAPNNKRVTFAHLVETDDLEFADPKNIKEARKQIEEAKKGNKAKI